MKNNSIHPPAAATAAAACAAIEAEIGEAAAVTVPPAAPLTTGVCCTTGMGFGGGMAAAGGGEASRCGATLQVGWALDAFGAIGGWDLTNGLSDLNWRPSRVKIVLRSLASVIHRHIRDGTSI